MPPARYHRIAMPCCAGAVQAGRYQRWRLVNTGYRAMVDLTVLDPATGLPTDKCDLQLLAKDGESEGAC